MSKFEYYITEEIVPDWEEWSRDSWSYVPVESPTSQNTIRKAFADAKSGDEIHLYINSLGGSVKEALGIYNYLRRCEARVIAHIDGFAASAASLIAMAADEVIMPRNTCMMIHNASWMAYGNPAQLRKSADDLEVINKSAIESYLMHAGDKLDESSLQRFLDAETWLTAAECFEYGFADTLEDASGNVDPMAQYADASAKCVRYPAAKITADIAAKLGAKPAAKAQKPSKPQPEAAVNNGSIYMLLKSFMEE